MLDECGLCGLLIDIHPRYRTLEALATARERDPEAHSWVEPGAAAAIRAQADEAWRNDLSTNWRTLALANQAQVEEYRAELAAVTAERDRQTRALQAIYVFAEKETVGTGRARILSAVVEAMRPMFAPSTGESNQEVK